MTKSAPVSPEKSKAVIVENRVVAASVRFPSNISSDRLLETLTQQRFALQEPCEDKPKAPQQSEIPHVSF